MDDAAHRAIKHARDTLVEGLGLSLLGPVQGQSYAHGLDVDQAAQLERIADDLYTLMLEDPAPPECAYCSSPITQPATGRPRRFCDDRCKAADYRARKSAEADQGPEGT